MTRRGTGDALRSLGSPSVLVIDEAQRLPKVCHIPRRAQDHMA